MAESKFKEIRDRVGKASKSAFSRTFRKALGKILANDIRTRTRLGRGVESTGRPSRKLKKLTSEKYKKSRASLKREGKLSTKTSPKKSNLTKTGQLLDALTGDARRDDEIEIKFNENRDDGVKNTDIVEGQEDQGRPFFYLTKAELNRMRRLIRKRIVQEIKKTFN